MTSSSSPSQVRLDLDGNTIKPLTICMIGAGGFIGSHLCEKLMNETNHTVLAVDVYNDKIKHLLEPESVPWTGRIQFHRLNIKNDSRLEGLIKCSDLTINLAAICTPADYNTRPLDTIYSNFIDALPVVKYCSENNKRLIHFSTCEVYGKTIGSYLPKDSPLRQDPAYYILKEDTSPCIFGSVEKQRWSYACAKQLIERLIYAEGAENGLEFTIVRPFNWIGPRMDFIPGIDGPSEGVPRVLASGHIFNVGIQRRHSGTCWNPLLHINTGHMLKPSSKQLQNQLQIRRGKKIKDSCSHVGSSCVSFSCFGSFSR